MHDEAEGKWASNATELWAAGDGEHKTVEGDSISDGATEDEAADLMDVIRKGLDNGLNIVRLYYRCFHAVKLKKNRISQASAPW